MSSISITEPQRPVSLSVLAAIAAAVVAVLVAGALYVRIASSPATVESRFSAGGASPIVGSVRVSTDQDDRATLVVDVSGLQPGESYIVHLHAGAPSQPSASTGVLGTLQASEHGAGQLTVTSVRAGATGAAIELTGALLADGPRFVDLHPANGGVQEAIATAPVPSP